MVNFLNLPGYNPGNALDFSSLSGAIDSNRQNALQQNQLGLQREQVGMQRERLGMEREQHSAQQHQVMAQRVGGMAQMGLNEKDPARRQAILDRIISLHPDKSKLGPEYLSPETAFPMLVQEAQGFMGRKEQAQIGLAEAQALKARREAATGGETPSNIREWQAFQRMSPEDQQRYLTMKRAEKYLDTGTQFVRPNPVQPGSPISTIPKDPGGKAEATALGQQRAQAQMDLPKVKENLNATIGYVDQVLKDPNLPNVTGWQGRLPTWRPESVDVEERIAQIGGRAFLSAFESLKGGGAITEVEGKKATDALARVSNLKQSDAGFKQALNDFKKEVQNLVVIAERRAQTGAAPQTPAAPSGSVRLKYNPATGELE